MCSLLFQLTMINNVDPMMAKTHNKNLVSKLWMKIRSSPIMAHKLSECIKLDEIVLTQVLGFVEDERTFNNLACMKTSYEIVWQHILLCVCMFSQIFFCLSYFSSLFNFSYEDVILRWKDLKVRYQVDWQNSFSIHIFNKKLVLTFVTTRHEQS